jgi:hypothetical protein
MGGGGKGGQSTQETVVKLPPEIEKAAKQNLKIADEVSKIGYVPYSGPTVAAFTPNQRAAMQNTSNAAAAFGMGNAQGMANPAVSGGGTAQVDPYTGLAMDPTLTGGVLGYSPKGIYDSAKAAIPEAQRQMIDSFVMNPNTGAAPTNPLVGATQLFGGGQQQQQQASPGKGAMGPQRGSFGGDMNGRGMSPMQQEFMMRYGQRPQEYGGSR